jgi:seryl-tRNA synthetase
MLDLKIIRTETDRVRRALEAKGAAQALDRVLALDEERRRLLQDVELKKAERNRSSQEIGTRKAAGEDTTSVQQEMKALSEEIKELDARVRQVEEDLETLLIWIPNLPHESVPLGPDASANVEVRRWGALPPESFRPLPHWEIGERLGLLDFRRASRISGSGFCVFTGQGARLQRALIQFMIDVHTNHHRFREVSVPYLVRRECMFGTGQLPKMEEDMYHCPVDDLFLIPTAEVPITNLYREDESLEEADLPIYHVGYSPCFRREAGAAGKDTRGLVRVHQFDKVEMVKIVTPVTSYDELESLTACAEAILQALELPYRVLALASGDLSFAAAKCYDLEAWSPAEGRWLEVSSCSNFEAFQARRMGLRYRTKEGRLEYPHTLNGSGLALPRVIVTLLEMHQTSQGSVRLPVALRPYMNGLEELGPEPGR